MGNNMIQCKYYNDGMCTVFGEKVLMSCATVSNITPELCKSSNRGGKKRKNGKRNNKNYS